MSIADAIGIAIFLLIGCAPLWFAYRARRRWVRMVLGLVAAILLPVVGSLLLLAGSGDSIQGGPVPIVMLILAFACLLAALMALVLAFVPVKAS
ncbi:MAG TPA: hypothetical protein VFV88_16410 [Steroidobacteraceae bacterium]|nr:hypothetical protein [Steroidobacteraceae bacterium]